MAAFTVLPRLGLEPGTIDQQINLSTIQCSNGSNIQWYNAYIQRRISRITLNIYIPGERSDTLVMPYYTGPMLCRECLQYGHTIEKIIV